MSTAIFSPDNFNFVTGSLKDIHFNQKRPCAISQLNLQLVEDQSSIELKKNQNGPIFKDLKDSFSHLVVYIKELMRKIIKSLKSSYAYFCHRKTVRAVEDLVNVETFAVSGLKSIDINFKINNKKISAKGTLALRQFTYRHNVFYAFKIEGSFCLSKKIVNFDNQFIVSKNVFELNSQADLNPKLIFKCMVINTLNNLLSKRCLEISEFVRRQWTFIDLNEVIGLHSIPSSLCAILNDSNKLKLTSNCQESITSFIDTNFDAEVFTTHLLDQESDTSSFNLFLALFNANENQLLDIPVAVEFKDSMIVPSVKVDQIQQRQQFFDILKSTYGSNLASKISERYNLFKSKDPLTFLNIKEIMLGIAARVSVDDLIWLFNAIKNEENMPVCHMLLSDVEKASLKEVASFAKLEVGLVNALLRCFTHHPYKAYLYNCLEVLFPDLVHPKQYEFNSLQARQDAEIIFANHQLSKITKKDMNFALSEHNAKRLAYADLDMGLIVPMFDTDSELNLYEVVLSLDNLHDGMVGNFLTPLVFDHQIMGGKSYPIYLNFRGTQPSNIRSNSGSSLVRDFDYRGVGRATFDSRTSEIAEKLDHIINHLAKDHKSVELFINGHSLGGADVQRCVAFLIDEIQKEDSHASFKKIKHITATAHNPPGVQKDVNQGFKEALETSKCSVDMNYVIYESDPIQHAGPLYLGHNIENPKLNVNVMLVSCPQFRHMKAHGAHGFIDNGFLLTHKLINKSQKKEIQKILGKWEGWDSKVGWSLYQASKIPVGIVHAGLYYLFRGGLMFHQYYSGALSRNVIINGDQLTQALAKRV
jgi:hypothetical protein